MLNPVHLKTLTVVLRLGSFADAARQLGYTGSAVSQQISALERQLKLTLFERDAHSIRPTPAATEIAARSASALGALQGLEDEIGSIANGTLGRLRVGSFPTASERLLPAALSNLRRERPHVDVHLDEDEPDGLMPMLERRELDVALVYRYRRVSPRWPAAVSLRRVLSEDLLLLRRAPAGPGGFVGEPADLAEYGPATWISTAENTWGAATLRQLGRAAGYDPMVSYRSNNYGVIQGLVAAGLGIALIPALAYRPSPGLTATPVTDSSATREVLVASVPSVPSDLVEAFEQAIRAATATVVARGPALRALA